MGPVRIRHWAHPVLPPIQSSHFVDRAGWQAKMASIGFWTDHCVMHTRPHWQVSQGIDIDWDIDDVRPPYEYYDVKDEDQFGGWQRTPFAPTSPSTTMRHTCSAGDQVHY